MAVLLIAFLCLPAIGFAAAITNVRRWHRINEQRIASGQNGKNRAVTQGSMRRTAITSFGLAMYLVLAIASLLPIDPTWRATITGESLIFAVGGAALGAVVELVDSWAFERAARSSNVIGE